MTIQDYENLEQCLLLNGYKKYQGGIINDDYYWCKGFAYYEDEYGEEYPSYQVAFSVWDYRDKGYNVPDHAMIGVAVRVIISGDGRIDLELTNITFDIKEIETKAQSFHEWAKQNFNV